MNSFATVNAVVTMVLLSLYLGWCVGHEKKITTEFIAAITALCGLGGYVYRNGDREK